MSRPPMPHGPQPVLAGFPLRPVQPKIAEVGSAIVLAGQTPVLHAGSVSGVTDTSQMKNPLALPIQVDEILFNIDPSVNGGDIGVDIRLGQEQITKAYTPLWVLGAGRNFSASGTAIYSGSPSPASPASAVFAAQNAPLYSARFESPFVVYPNESIVCLVSNAGILNPADVTARVIIKARVMPAATRRTSLPWICYWKGALNPQTFDGEEESYETDLFNPFGVPLSVERFIGGIGSYVVAAPPVSGWYQDPATIDAALDYATLRMVDGTGRPIIRDATPLGHVFQMQDFSWRVRAQLPPAGFYKAYLEEDYAGIGLGYAVTMQAFIGMVGHRATN